MKQPIQRGRGRSKAAEPAAPPDPLLLLKRLIWLYFWLLIFEGALRKWALPSLSNVLLVVRDPVVVAIYGVAIWKKRFPSNAFITTLAVLGALSFTVSLFVERANLVVNVYGLRCNFLHLPLIYVIGGVFTFADVKRIGRWTLIMAVPMAALLVAQFRASPDSRLNAGAGESGAMIAGEEGHVRPSGTFSFVVGVIFFYAQTVAFLLYGLVERKSYPLWLVAAAGLAAPAAMAVSGSRSVLAAVAIVLAAYGVVLLLRPQLLMKSGKLIVLVVVAGALAGSVSFVQDGIEALLIRLFHAGQVEGGGAGFFRRILSGFIDPLLYMMKVPLLGDGQGMGTNVGISLMGIKAGDWREGEWERVIYESGPFLGLPYLILRVAIVLDLARRTMRAAWAGSFLPFLLLAACGFQILTGQFGQATTLGFTVFCAGLVLASLRSPPGPASLPSPPPGGRRRVPEKVRAQWAEARARMEAARPRPSNRFQPKAHP